MSTEPVKAIIETSSASTRACPVSTSPVTTLITPGGKILAMPSASSRVDRGVHGDGLTMTELPAASAGASFHINSRRG